MPNVELLFHDRIETFSVRGFRVEASISAPFAISLSARSDFDDADLDALTGSAATVIVRTSAVDNNRVLRWTGVCAHAELVHAESGGLSTYSLSIVPKLWLLGHRTNCRVFRRMTGFEMAATILREWGVDFSMRIDAASFPVLDFRIQYNESDLAFVSRMLEEAGIAYVFETVDERTTVVFVDRPAQAELSRPPLPFVAEPSAAVANLYVTRLYRSTHVRSGAQRIRDYDFLRPSFALVGQATSHPPEDRLERYENLPGASQTLLDPNGQTADAVELANVAQRRLDALRTDSKALSFESSALDLAPGSIIAILGHPRTDINPDTRLLLVQTSLQGSIDGEVVMIARAVFAALPFRPPLLTAKPRIMSVQSATVVGPPEEELHVDEFGRVRVLFVWDQEGARNEGSSCWVRVSQAWAGGGFGIVALPRIGDEVLVAFLDGNPDEPVIVGRLYNAARIQPWRLPQEKTKTGIRTQSMLGEGGYNELSFEDRAGFESIRLHAHRDLIENVQSNHHSTVHANRIQHVRGNATSLVDGSNSETTLLSASLMFKADKVETIDGPSTLTHNSTSTVQAHADRREHYGGSFHRLIHGLATLSYGGGKQELISGNVDERVLGDSSILYAGARNVQIEGPAFVAFGNSAHATASEASFTAGKGSDQGRVRIRKDGQISVEAPTITLTAERQVTLCVGSSSITILDEKITLDSKTIEIAAKDEVDVTTDSASTVWTGNVVAKAGALKLVSSEGSSLDLGSTAKLGPNVSLGVSTSAEKKAFQRRQAEAATAPRTRIMLTDAKGQAISGAEYEVSMPGYIDRGTGDSVEVPVFDDIESCLLRWGRPLSDREPGASEAKYEFQSTIYLSTEVPGDAEETARRRLSNMGYQQDSVHAAKHAFARHMGMSPEDQDAVTSKITEKHGA